MLLVPIMNQILEVKSSFDDLSFTHIYRAFNTKVDQLSKGSCIIAGWVNI